MKKIFFALALLLISVVSIEAQESSEVYEREYGIDAFFINRFLPLEQNIGSSSPYLFNMQKWNEQGKIRRMGLNLNISGIANSKENDANVSLNTMALAYRYGWGKRRPAFKNATWSLGTDVLFSPQYQIIKRLSNPQNMEEPITTKNLSLEFDIGGGLWAGFQYNFTERVGLYTEFTAYLSMTYEYQESSSDSENFEGIKNSLFEYRNRYKLPVSMVVFVKL